MRAAGYIVEALVGEGGFARVYRARRERDGAVVALKVARKRDDPRWPREIETLRRLDGVGAPRVHAEACDADGFPLIVLDYLRGRCLSSWLAAHDPPDLDAAVSMFQRACAPVSRLHSLGIAHRDLKPDNLLVLDETGDVVLIDFGLAREFGTKLDAQSRVDRVTASDELVGSPAYWPPERCGGSAAVHATEDVYALGVVLFELLTGRRPFVGNAAETRYAHAIRRAPRPSALRAGAAEFDPVVARCLDKAPERRYASARELLDAIDELRANDRTRPTVHHGVPSVVPFVGREPELSAIASAAGAGLAGDGALVTVIGAPGHGKSRLLDEACARLRKTGVTVQRVRCETDVAGGKALSRALLRTALPTLSAKPEANHVRHVLAELVGPERVAVCLAAVANTLGIVHDDDPAVARRAVAPGALRYGVADAIACGLRAAARREGGLVIAVDDAHLGDLAALDALELATMDDGNAAPLAVVVAAAPSLDTRRRGWGRRAQVEARVDLGPLRARAARELLSALLAPVQYVARPLLSKLASAADGVPAFIVELGRDLHRNGAVRQNSSTGGYYLAADAAVGLGGGSLARQLARRSLDALAPAERALAECCAVLCDDVRAGDVAGVLDHFRDLSEDDEDVVPPSIGLRRLVERGLLEPRHGEAYRFRNPMIRDALESLVPEARRVCLHEAARRWTSHAARQLQVRQARHAAAAGAASEAVALYAELGDHARRCHAYAEADQHYTIALEHARDADAERRQAILAGRADVRYRSQRLPESLEDLDTACDLAVARADTVGEIELQLQRATVLDWASDWAASAEAADRAHDLADGADIDTGLEARLALAAGRSRWRGECVDAAVPLLENASRLGKLAGDYETHVVARLLLGCAYTWGERHDDSLAVFEEVITDCEELGDRLHQAIAHGNRMLTWARLGKIEEATRDLRRAAYWARQYGEARVERFSLYNLAELHYYLGNVDDALPLAQRTRDLQLQFVEHRGPEDTCLLARIHAAAGRHREAAELIDWIEQHCPEDTLTRTSRILLQMVRLLTRGVPADVAVVDRCLADWRRLAGEAEVLGAVNEELEVMYWAGRWATKVGRLSEARRWTAQACARVGHHALARPLERLAAEVGAA